MKTAIDYDAVFAALNLWRRDIPEDPAVSAIAVELTRDPWAVLVSTILSLRTKDAVTLETSRKLLKRAPTPQALLELQEEEIAALAYPSSFYKTKAGSLRRIAAILIDEHGGRVPADQAALLALPGVGLKTANLVLQEAFDLDAICVDTHVHRISNRLGWIATETPDESEAALRATLPLRHWKIINALLVSFGQRVCAPVSPRCSACPIAAHCARVGVTKSR
jgi:endonuclease III